MYEVIEKQQFIDDMIKLRPTKKIRLFFDIETYQYNEKQGKDKPTLYKNMVYSVAISYFYIDTLRIVIFPNFKEFFDCILQANKGYKTNPTFELIAHNSNKYDNHFLRNDLIYYYDLPYTNMYLNNATDKANFLSYKLKDISKKDKEKGIILEKRVKSRNNLELVFYMENIKFFTTDSYMKTHTSIKSLGDRLLRINKITSEELKTDYDYTKYNQPNDMTQEQARNYSLAIFEDLTDDELKYIRNDVIILALAVEYYSKIFQGFDFEKITFTRNILDSYNTNDLTSYQLLKTLGSGKNKLQVQYTDYHFNNTNLYDYLKSFYNGGLNFYNDSLIGKIIDVECFGMDINSSYPAVMYKEKIPTFINSFEEFDKLETVNIKDIEEKDTFILYRTTRQVFDDYIITRIKSRVIRKMLVKYYSKNEYININSYTIKMIEEITDLRITELPILSYIKYDCVYFGSRDILADYYRVKTQGKETKKMNMTDLNNIFPTDEDNTILYTSEEIDIAKLNLNGLYGIPALRPYFNIFRWQGTELNNIENGFQNSQRNVVFSIFVTAVSVYNLLYPFKFLTSEEIDKGFLYCDTDSLYFTKEVSKKIPDYLFNPYNLGAWDIQNETIEKFYILNHKKYTYQENGKITVKCGGVPRETFDLTVSFEEFIKNQFSHGTVLKSTRSVFNQDQNISIYETDIFLEQGLPYPSFSYDYEYQEKKREILEKAKEELDGFEDEGLYIESTIGTFSISELYEVTHTLRALPISFYKQKEDYIRYNIL